MLSAILGSSVTHDVLRLLALAPSFATAARPGSPLARGWTLVALRGAFAELGYPIAEDAGALPWRLPRSRGQWVAEDHDACSWSAHQFAAPADAVHAAADLDHSVSAALADHALEVGWSVRAGGT